MRRINGGSCAVTTCTNTAQKRGWCGGHYYRWRTTGDVRADVPLRRSHDVEHQLMTKIAKDDETGHWFWTGHVNAVTGYGMVKLPGANPTGAHRAVYEHLVGPIPDGHEPDHVCHVRHCVNVLDPTHVEVVTRAENNRRSVIYKREVSKR